MTTNESTFGLGRAVLGSKAFLQISAEDYSSLLSAKAFVSETLAFEEKYDLLVSNFLELEKTLNELAADHMVRSDYSYQSLNDCRVLINQRVQNLLGACRLYLDHGAHHVSSMDSAVPNLAKEFDALRRKQYDDHAAYRIAEALRNHSQHRGFPIGKLSSGGGWIQRPDGDDILRHRVQIHIDVDELRDGKTKASVLKDIENLGPNADARPVLREYVARLSALHQLIRLKLQEALAAQESAIETAIDRFKNTFPEEDSIIGLAAVERNPDGTWSSHSALFMAMIERRRHFLTRNGNLNKLKQWHVSSEPK
jgi:hypothetical protein